MARVGQKRKTIARRGLMLVLSSPSGAGKTTLSRMLLKADRGVELSVSVTTRPKRRGEVDGRDYHFIDRARFDAMVKTGAASGMGRSFRPLLRHAAQAGAKGAGAGAAMCCSTSIGRARSSSARKRAAIIASIFVLPPSITELERRLHTRALDDRCCHPESRMAKAAGEISHWPEYDYVIINDTLDQPSPRCRRSSPPSG